MFHIPYAMNKVYTRNPNIRTRGNVFIDLYKICHVIKILVLPNSKICIKNRFPFSPNVRIFCIHFANCMSNEEIHFHKHPIIVSVVIGQKPPFCTYSIYIYKCIFEGGPQHS